MAVMTPTRARNRFFILAPLGPRWLVWLAEEEQTSTKSERRAGLLGLSYAGRWHVNEARQCGTSMRRVKCAHGCEGVNQGASAWIISSTSQRHFQGFWTPSAGASSKGLEAGRGWRCRTHHKGPVSCPRLRVNFPRLRCRQPTYRNDYNRKTVLSSRSAFPS